MAIPRNPDLVLVLFYVLVISLLPLNISPTPIDEAKALVKWKESLYNTSSLNSWSLNNLNYLCNWKGITCNTAGTVSDLDVASEGLKGTLAHFNFSSFPNLTYLDMGGNRLSGSVPVNIGNATQLQHLFLHANRLDGNITYQISHLF